MNFDYHPWNFLVLPVLVVSCGSCDTPGCDSEHWWISTGWFLWSIHFDFSHEHL